MAEITKAIQLYPWPRGQYSNSDPMQIPYSMAQSIVNGVLLGTRDNPGGVGTRPGIVYQNEEGQIKESSTGEDVIFHCEYWANITGSKQQRFVAVTADRNVFADNYGGSWGTQLNDSSVVLSSFSEGGVTSEVMNEDLILGFKGSTDSVLVWEAQDPSTGLVKLSATGGFSGVVGGNFFQGIKRCWIFRQHQSRMFYAGDPQNPDTIYFSKAFTYNQFDVSGTNPAGNIQIFPGDGDPEGIRAIFPSLNAQELYVAKRKKLYKIITSDTDPDNWAIVKVSDEIGCVNHNTAKTIDQRDIYFESDLGVHSLFQVISGTQALEGALISYPITKDLREEVNLVAKSAHSAVYDSTRNRYLLAVKSATSEDFDRIYCYDIENNGWTVWETSAEGVTFNFLSKQFDASTGQTRVYVGGDNGYIYEFDPDTKTDLTNNSISLEVTTALIFPSESFLTESNYTDAFVLARVTSDNELSLSFRVDNGGLVSSISEAEAGGSNTLNVTPLGPTFILGVGRGVRPFPFSLNSIGYGIEITLNHDVLGNSIEIYGLIIKYENAQESRTTLGIGS